MNWAVAIVNIWVVRSVCFLRQPPRNILWFQLEKMFSGECSITFVRLIDFLKNFLRGFYGVYYFSLLVFDFGTVFDFGLCRRLSRLLLLGILGSRMLVALLQANIRHFILEHLGIKHTHLSSSK